MVTYLHTALLALALSMLWPTSNVVAQPVSYGAALELGKKWDLPRAWSLSVGPALEIRPFHTGYLGEESSTGTAPPALRNADLNVGVERRWLERWSFGTGLRARRRFVISYAEAVELRSWWYATRTGDIRYWRVQQKFRTEQRWRGDQGEDLSLSFRHRYRVAAEHALRGLSVDKNEWAVTTGLEILVSNDDIAGELQSFDVRPYVGLAKADYEIGLESRYERTLTEAQNTWQQAVLVVVQYSF